MTHLSAQSKKRIIYSLVSKAKPAGTFINTRLTAWRKGRNNENSRGMGRNALASGAAVKAKERAQGSQQDDDEPSWSGTWTSA